LQWLDGLLSILQIQKRLGLHSNARRTRAEVSLCYGIQSDEEERKMRKSIPKAKRQEVFAKYDGHCAYCGQSIEYKDMQVDHLQSVMIYGDNTEIENLMPSCRMCNYYKDTMTIERFREELGELKKRLHYKFIYRLAKAYGLIVEIDKPIEFYFEKICKEQDND
jgi:hypothetical protein